MPKTPQIPEPGRTNAPLPSSALRRVLIPTKQSDTTDGSKLSLGVCIEGEATS